MEWFLNNVGTITVSAVLFAVLALISVKLIKDKKKGKTSCGCNCAHCALAGQCHKGK